MSEMVDRVKTVISDAVNSGRQVAFEDVARNVIRAMREPTSQMSAAWNRDAADWIEEVIEDHDHPWKCMIDAALK